MAGKKLNVNIKADEKQFANSIMESTHQIWLAGLGAFSIAQDEGGRLFDKLVAEGKTVEKKTRRVVDDKSDDVKDTVDGVREKAEKNWDKLEQLFQDRVAKALNRLGVPTRDDLKELMARVSDLSEAVKELAARDRPVSERVAEAVIDARDEAGELVKTLADKADSAAAKSTRRVKKAGDDVTATVRKTATRANRTLKKAANETDAAVRKTTRQARKVVSA
jgi:poly(hydroxyalkanoate) granule-associated protein